MGHVDAEAAALRLRFGLLLAGFAGQPPVARRLALVVHRAGPPGLAFGEPEDRLWPRRHTFAAFPSIPGPA
jgi:hypothetical protein